MVLHLNNRFLLLFISYFLQISPEEKLQICQHYLLSSPPGQFKEVLSDVRKLIPSDLLSDALAGGIARVANLKNFAVVSAPSGNKVNDPNIHHSCSHARYFPIFSSYAS